MTVSWGKKSAGALELLAMNTSSDFEKTLIQYIRFTVKESC
jgi:hypothetical protein